MNEQEINNNKTKTLILTSFNWLKIPKIDKRKDRERMYGPLCIEAIAGTGKAYIAQLVSHILYNIHT
jgi:hypothetical protein